jgi:hypothetical protein
MRSIKEILNIVYKTDNKYTRGEYNKSDLNKLSEGELLLLMKSNPYHIKNIANPSESVQRACVENIRYYDNIDDKIVDVDITIESIREIYYKMKKVRGIIK